MVPKPSGPLGNDSISSRFGVMVRIAMNDLSILQPIVLRRHRFQRGSLQKRKSGGCWKWIAFWWEDRHRKSQILGPSSTMSRPEALAEMANVLRPVNDRAGEP